MEALGIIIYIRWKMSLDSKYMPVYTAKSAWIAVALPLPPLWAEKLPPTEGPGFCPRPSYQGRHP